MIPRPLASTSVPPPGLADPVEVGRDVEQVVYTQREFGLLEHPDTEIDVGQPLTAELLAVGAFLDPVAAKIAQCAAESETADSVVRQRLQAGVGLPLSEDRSVHAPEDDVLEAGQ